MELIIAALTFGITAGLKPGPLGIYVIHQTLSHGARSGLLASFAPFISDGPIIFGSFLLINLFRQFDLFITIITVLGALYIAWVAIKLIIATPSTQQPASAPSSFLTAVKINLLNPAPYIFWGTVGGTYLLQNDLPEAILFALLFLATLSITKFIMALTIKSLGSRFSNMYITYTLKILALLLMFFAVRLLLDAF
jgi:threonine/homoserine/homoserine lactone efflux protein